MPQFQGGGPDQGQARRLARTRRLHASAPDVDLGDRSRDITGVTDKGVTPGNSKKGLAFGALLVDRDEDT